VHSEHNADFWNLMSSLKKEADQLDWTKSRGQKLGGGGTEAYKQEKLREKLISERAEGGHDEDNYGITTYSLVPEFEPSFEGSSHKLGGRDFLDESDNRNLTPRSRLREQRLIALAIRKSRRDVNSSQNDKNESDTDFTSKSSEI
jgi:hypothetical protein